MCGIEGEIEKEKKKQGQLYIRKAMRIFYII